ncbi:MAG TPA: hypothetical protein VMY39_00110 [Planctomycetota bacterium]|nr:hypothetical protein [Planctomycetota bacterium]
MSRRCDRTPYLELAEYLDECDTMEIRSVITATTAEGRVRQGEAALASGSVVYPLDRLLRRVLEVESDRMYAERDDIDRNLGAFGRGSKNALLCPLLKITRASDRWLLAYRRAVSLTTGMGGAGSWSGNGAANEDCRRLDAFSVIRAAINERQDRG